MTGISISSFPEAQARTQTTYDEFPYVSNAFPQTHPARMAAVGALFNLRMPNVETARVLEIGCASGGNLIPLASAFPKGRFLGIDLSAIQIEEGRRRIETLGLNNIELRHQDLSSFRRPGERYDYIICHGVYSWVPEPVREAILEICSSHLDYHGVACVSYNVLPGWRPKQVLRDALLSRVGQISDQRERVARAREFMGFLAEYAPDNPYGAAIKEGVSQAQQGTDDYLAHELLELDNTPCSFREFMNGVNRHKLAFLGESDVSMMVPDNFGSELARVLRKLGENDLHALEGYIDVMTGRTFRQTLLINPARAPAAKRIVEIPRLEGLHLLGDITEVPANSQDYPYCFQNDRGRQLQVRGEMVRKALQVMVGRRPATSNLRQLVDELKKNGERPSAQEMNEIGAALLQGVLAGLFIARSLPVVIGPRDTQRPKALALARGDAAVGRIRTVNLRHDNIDIGVVAQHLLPVMDGTRDREQLHAHLLERVRAGALHFQRQGVQITDEADIVASAREHLVATIERLWQNALLEA